jgi:glutamate synthase (NADPH/NADH) small chain
MSAYAHELTSARKEGVRVVASSVPVGFLRDGQGQLIGVTVADTDGGRPCPGTEHDIRCDLVGLAIGQARVETIAAELTGVTLDRRGRIVVDEQTKRTAHPKVYAGGDCVNGGKEVVNAVADGRDAAKAMMAEWRGLEAGRG